MGILADSVKIQINLYIENKIGLFIDSLNFSCYLGQDAIVFDIFAFFSGQGAMYYLYFNRNLETPLYFLRFS